MRVIGPRSVEDYTAWYLRREGGKGDSRPIPDRPERQVGAMWERHGGKMRSWFSSTTRWQIVSLAISDFGDLVFLESEWTRAEGLVVPGTPNYRLLRRVADIAIATGYLARPSAYRHKAYYDQLAAGSLRLAGENRVAICSAEASEISSNPNARHYLLDGVGRCLPYMILVAERTLEYGPIEAFLAER